MAEQTKMKVPQIRFKGFSGEWEEKTLGEICSDTYGGGTPSTAKEDYWNGEIPWIQSSDLVSEELTDIVPKKGISRQGLRFSAAKLVPENSIAAVTRVGVGKLAYIPFVYSTSQDFLSLSRLKIDGWYAAYSIWFKLQKKLHEVQGTSIKGVTKKKLLLTSLMVPGIGKEQSRIGEFLKELDRMIKLHQRKHKKLVTLKKAMLKKMFPQNGVAFPEIRFKGFLLPWDEKVLGDVFTNITNNTLSRAELNYDAGVAKNIHYGDILVKFRETLDVQRDEIPFVSNFAQVSKFKSSHLQDGDIIIADAAEDEMVGKCVELVKVHDEIVIAGLHTIALRPNIYFASKYLGYFINSPAFHSQLLSLMQGTKVLSISKSSIMSTKVLFPADNAEQQKIGAYFSQLDELIAKHETQVKKLRQIKVACLDKMFV